MESLLKSLYFFNNYFKLFTQKTFKNILKTKDFLWEKHYQKFSFEHLKFNSDKPKIKVSSHVTESNNNGFKFYKS